MAGWAVAGLLHANRSNLATCTAVRGTCLHAMARLHLFPCMMIWMHSPDYLSCLTPTRYRSCIHWAPSFLAPRSLIILPKANNEHYFCSCSIVKNSIFRYIRTIYIDAWEQIVVQPLAQMSNHACALISMLLAASIDRVAGPVGVCVALESSIATTRRN
jgi:hypothetical protein